ncbi:MAG: thioether cross-link-forming SCIFF peptide maturase, partial [Oscillospiraceae bacterium]|nr:thioether cross-link-forming SCIFF peptide maturase [Oscillospiraceae bacterium]
MIHLYEQNGYKICLDVHSGAVHLPDDTAYDLLPFTCEDMTGDIPEAAVNALSEKYPSEDIMETWGELYDLHKTGQLHARDDYARFAGGMGPAPIKSMCLNIAHDCNLACGYCFAGKGGFGGDRVLMSGDVGKAAIDFLIEQSAERRNLEVDFFGGEPLMNFDAVKSVVGYARSLEKAHGKNFRFTITTNGLLLDDDSINFINQEMHNCVLSIDGRPGINDRLRVDRGGSGCYGRIVPKFQQLVAGRGGKDYYARATYTKYNLDFAGDVLHLYRLGFRHISAEPVVAGRDEPFAITEADLPRIFDEYEKLALILLEMKKNGEHISFFHFLIDLDQGPCAIRRLRGCSSGNEYVAVTPSGDVYPCHSFVGDKSWRMGSVLDKSFDQGVKERFAKTNIYSKEECKNCWAKFYCSGGCHAINHQQT